MKHNKKRNPAFLYEILIREIAKSSMLKVENNTKLASELLKKYFIKNSEISKELNCYNSILSLKDTNPNKDFLNAVIQETKRNYSELNFKKLNDEKNKLISILNENFNKNIWSNFIPNYKNLATIYQIFQKDIPIKKRVMLESTLISDISEGLERNNIQNIDNLTYKTFIKKFNDKYRALSKRQNKLLMEYVYAFEDNGINLKLFLNEEVGELKNTISNYIIENTEYKEKFSKVLEVLESFNKKIILKEDLIKILQIQELVEEIKNNGRY